MLHTTRIKFITGVVVSVVVSIVVVVVVSIQPFVCRWVIPVVLNDPRIYGGIRQRNQLTIAIVCAVIFAVLLATILFTTLLIQPLNRLSQSATQMSRMNVRLMQHLSPSIFTEITMVIEALNILTSSLRRMRAFLPQSLVFEGDYSDNDVNGDEDQV